MATVLKKPSPAAAPESPFSISTGIKSADPYVKMLVYGDAGAGKTVLAAQAVDVPSMRDVLIINAEAGTKSIVESEAVQNHELIDSVEVQSYETFVAIYEWLLKHCNARDAKDQAKLDALSAKYGFPKGRKYRTVIVDSLSEIEQVNLSRIFGDDADDLMDAAEAADFRDYGQNRRLLHKVIRAFRNLPMNVIFTCARDWDQDEKKKYGYQPKLTGKLSKDVQFFMDIVGYLATGKSGNDEGGGDKLARRLWLQPIGKFDAKSRLTPQDVGYIDNPTMPKLMSKLTRKGSSK